MSFNSAYWTIPELCVWIVTRKSDALSRLSPAVRQSLMLCDSIHSGAYAARDDVLEAAQKGRIVVTCDGEPDRYRSNPDRQTLTAEFWETAELEDTGHWQAGDSRRGGTTEQAGAVR